MHWTRLLIPLFLICSLQPATAAAGSPDSAYDVSYLWSTDLDSARDYQQRVAKVLGSEVASSLRIVTRYGLYGLIYDRSGDREGAVKVAGVHSRLLRSRGLEPAAAIRTADWQVVDQNTASKIRPAASRQATGRIQQVSSSTMAEQTQRLQDLEILVESYIDELRSKGKLAADERTGWSVYDFTSGEKLVTINEDLQFQAASLIKPFVATAFFHKVKDGDLIYGSKSRRHMERMIQHSSNRSTNWVMRHVGGPQAVERILKKHYPEIFKDIHLVEYIPASGRTYRNKASVHDYSRFLYALWEEQIPGAREIKRLMALPGSDRLYTGAKDIPAGTRVYNKTGSTSRLCADMGILIVKGKDGRSYPYTLIGIIEKQNRARHYGSWIRARGDVIRNVSNLVYREIADRHSL